jgi:hypothetical protein
MFPFTEVLFGIVSSIEMLVASSIPWWERTLRVSVCINTVTPGLVTEPLAFRVPRNQSQRSSPWNKTDNQTHRHVFSWLFDSCVVFALQAIRHAIFSADAHERNSDRNVMALHTELISVTLLRPWASPQDHPVTAYHFQLHFINLQIPFFIHPTHCRLENIELTWGESGLFPLYLDSFERNDLMM